MRHFSSSLAAAFALAALTSPTFAADQPSDPQIAHIAYTAGDIDVKAGQLALEKSQNKAVRTFANDMVRDHTAVNDKALALVKKLNVTPEDNGTSKALAEQAAQKHAELSKLSGAAFEPAPHVMFGAATDGDARSPSKNKGNHGFWPTRPDYHSIFLLSGPGIKAEALGTIEMVSLENRLEQALGIACPH